MIKGAEVTFQFKSKNWQDNYASVQRSEYPDGTTKLTVTGRRGEVLCVPTVCLQDLGEWPADGHVFIADYGSTEGTLRTLQDNGVVGRTNRIVETAVNTRDPLLRRSVHECKLLTTDI